VHLIAALGLLACTELPMEGGDSGESAPLPPEVSLGTGTEDFVEVQDGDEVIIVFGPQGGYHLDGSLRLQGLNAGVHTDLSHPDNPTTTFEVLTSGGEPVSGLDGDNTITYVQGIDPTDEPGVYEMVGRRIFLDIDDDDELVGDLLTVTVTVVDVDGIRVEDSHALLAVPHPQN
jgi:hypothetical protein